MNQYVICTVPRSGSNLLAEALSATGIAGRPLEYFNPDYRDFFLDRWQRPRTLSESEFLNEACRAGTTPNGMFGAKLQWPHVGRLAGGVQAREDSENSTERFLSHFPRAKCVLLTRADKLRQAISWYRASHKNTWWYIDGVHDPRARTSEDPPFHYAAIKRYEGVLLEYETAWQRLFVAIGIRPLRIEYDELCSDLQSTVKYVLKYLGTSPLVGRPVGHPRLKRQSDQLTEEWVHSCITIERQARTYDARCYGPNCGAG
jgi:trehalose 2-sulfotransferase